MGEARAGLPSSTHWHCQRGGGVGGELRWHMGESLVLFLTAECLRLCRRANRSGGRGR